jgi:uncharacterized coiled-coil DUF342 family protein
MEPHRQIAEFIKAGNATFYLLQQGMRLTPGEEKSITETLGRLGKALEDWQKKQAPPKTS